MNVDEALAAFARNGPADGDWAAYRERQRQATEVLEQLSGEELHAAIPALVKLIEASQDIAAQAVLAVPLARHEQTRFVERIARAPFSKPYLDAILWLDALGLDVWPLVLRMLADEQLRPEDTVRVLATVARSRERFEEVVAAAPAVALKLCWELRLWKQQPLGERKPAVVRFALGTGDEALRIDALRLISSDGELDDAALVALEALFPTASLPLACALAALSVRQWVSRGVQPDALLRDPRAEVRRAAFEAFAPSGALLAVIAGWSDPDSGIRATAERVLRERCAAEPLGPEPLAAIAKQLDGRPDVSAFLVWVAGAQPAVRGWCLEHLPAAHPVHVTLSAALTRVCARCRELSRGSTWHLDWQEPKARSKLEYVAELESDIEQRTLLLRCPDCLAHFTLLEVSIVDVNSRDDTWVLTRLRLAELRERYAKHVDFTRPRLVTYLEAAKADLQHVDAKVRADAEWELGA